jgi:uncharacterized lipoprotein YehR (DUF1307 family)
MPNETAQDLCGVIETLISCIRRQDNIIQQANISIETKEEAARLAENAERAFKCMEH